MRCPIHVRGGFTLALIQFCAVLAAPHPAAAQFNNPNIPGSAPVFLPPSYGATPLSTVIQAEASYLVGLGVLLEKEGIARRHHAAAAEHEIRNSLLWVQTYFERKEVNRAFYKKYHPDYLDWQAKQQQKVERRIEELPELALEGDPSDELNAMLDRVAGSTLAHDFLSESNPLVDSEIDTPLLEGDLAHLFLTDGGKRSGQILTFRPNDPQALDPRWPLALRGAEFDAVREAFETARNQAVAELGDRGQLKPETERALFDAMDALSAKFFQEYPYSRRATSQDFLVFNAGKRYVQSLALGVFRVVETNDARLFDGSYKFTGSSLVQLVGHLCRYGLQFAPPAPGDEGTYRKTFNGLRRLYLHLESDEATAQAAPAEGDK